MNQQALIRPSEVRKILERIEVRPSKNLGQNFLIDQNVLNLLLNYADVSPDDVVLEVGPGLGVVTHELAAQARQVIAVEKDRRLVRYLSHHLGNAAHVSLRHADILDVFPQELPIHTITKVVANLPYSISGRFLTKLCLHPDGPADIVITVQQEVCRRLVASPGGKQYGALSVFAQAQYKPQLCKTIRPSCFLPRPQVLSSIVHLQRKRNQDLDPAMTLLLQQLVKMCFSNRRKQLGTIFNHAAPTLRLNYAKLRSELHALGLNEKNRPEQVSPQGWLQLAQSLLY